MGGSACGAPLGPPNDGDDEPGAERLYARPLPLTLGGGGCGVGMPVGAPDVRSGELVSGAAGRWCCPGVTIGGRAAGVRALSLSGG